MLCLFSLSRGLGQSVVGTVRDTAGTGIPYLTIGLLRDSTLVKGTSSDEKGNFEFAELRPGAYRVSINDPLFSSFLSDSFMLDSVSHIRVPDIMLQGNARNIDEVSVVTLKRPIEFKNGNITVNIEDSPLAVGNSVYDLLSKMPGVIVDNDNISIQGKSGVSILIDDRRQVVAGQQLVNLLRSMPASSVEKIEIIRNPGARYDAAGTGGIINVKTKKIKVTGWSGNLGYTWSQGLKTMNNANANLNYKGKSMAFFSSIAGYEGTYINDADVIKKVAFQGDETVLDSRSKMYDVARYVNVGLGADWYINKRNTVGARIEVIPGDANRWREGNNALSDDRLGYRNLVYKRTTPNEFLLINYNLNSEHHLDTNGTKLIFSTDVYGPYIDYYNTSYEYNFTNQAGFDVLPPREDTAYNTVDLRVISSRLDFEKRVNKSVLFSAGLKAAWQNIFSDYEFATRDSQSGIYEVDTMFTNNFVYRELISAAYLSVQKDWKKWNSNFGLRAENTEVESKSRLKSFEFRRQYFRLFPTISLNYNPSEKHAWSVVLNRRIWRPDYNNFNPYYTFNNLFSISRGNPYLMPEIFYMAEFSHTYKSKFSNSFSFMRSDSPIRPQSQQDDSTMVSYLQTGNLIRSNEMRYFIYYGADIKKWWNVSFNVGGWYYDFYGMIDGQPLRSKAFSYNLWTNQTFALGKELKAELSGWFVGPWLYGGFYWVKPRGAVNVGIKRTLFDKSLNVKLTVNDVFFTNLYITEVKFVNQDYITYQTFDSRRVNLSLSYDFGKVKVRKREIKRAEEEKGRMEK